MASELKILYARITDRAAAIAASQPNWPCRRGCDDCCRSLADIPRLSTPEWALLREAIANLPSEVRNEVCDRIVSLTPERPVVCPFLSREDGACLVYEHRPAACRAYGFYMDRDKGLYCSRIQNLVESGACDYVVWGNAASIEAGLGEQTDLVTWFRSNPPSR